MEPTESSNDIPYFVGSYSEAQNHFHAGVDGKLGIASAIYPAQSTDLGNADFPYRQKIRGDGACYLNACLVGILNKCVGDEMKLQKFKANLNKKYPSTKDIINQIELRAKINSDGTSQNGLDRKKLNQMLQDKGNQNLGTQLAKAILIPKHQELIDTYDEKIASQEKVIKEAESNKTKYTQYYLDAFNEYIETVDGLALLDKTLPNFNNYYEENVKIMKDHFQRIHDYQISKNDPDENNPFKKLRRLAGNPSADEDKRGIFESIPNKIYGSQKEIATKEAYKKHIILVIGYENFATSYEEDMLFRIAEELTESMGSEGGKLTIQTFERLALEDHSFQEHYNIDRIYLINLGGNAHFDLMYNKNDPICVELKSQDNQATQTREDKKINEQQERRKLITEIEELKKNSQNVSEDLINEILNRKKLEDVDLEILNLLKSIYETSSDEAQNSKTKVKEEVQKNLESKTAGDSTKTSTPKDNSLDPKTCFDLAFEEIIENEGPNQELFETYLQAIKEGDQATQDKNFQGQLCHYAAKKGKSLFIPSLIKILPDSFKTIEWLGNTPLMWAIANAKNEFAFDLIEQSKSSNVDIGIDHISVAGTNALHLATAKGYIKEDKDDKIPNSLLINKLIESGANPNIETSLGLSALDIGVLRADSELVKSILLSSKSKIEKHTILKAIEKIDLISFDEAKNKPLKTCNFFNDVDESSFDSNDESSFDRNKETIKIILLENLHINFPESVQEQEDKRKTDIIIGKQLEIFNQLFEQNRVKKDKKQNLKEHVEPGMDWWVFPGYTNNAGQDKFTATEKIYTRLARDQKYCQRYKTFIYQYMDSFGIDEQITHKIRFSKLVESLIGMTNNGERTLAGFTQKEQDILFITVNNFYKEKGGEGLIYNENYTKHFQNLEKIAGESKEIDCYKWIDSAREKLRARLELDKGQTRSETIIKRQEEPIFENDKKLDPAQKDDFLKRSNPYSLNNKIGCGTLKERIGDQEALYPFCHFRITHDPIAERDSASHSDEVKLIDNAEYLKHPPITAICIDYPDYGGDDILPPPEVLKNTYKQKTLETLTLYNKLEVDHLVKHGDGMGVFLNQIRRGQERLLTVTETACSDYLDGFFEAITEFYEKNPNATLKKITFVTIDPKFPEKDPNLEKIFSNKLEAFSKNLRTSQILNLVEIKQDKAGPRFNSSKYYEQGAKKLGMTIAPNGDKKFLGGALNKGNVLEEQITLLSDMASIGNPVFNPNVTKKLSIFKDQRSDYCTLFHQDKYDSPVIEFNTEKDSKFDYKKILDKNKKFNSEEFTKEKEQEEILKLLRKAKDDTLTTLNISKIDDNFFIAVMKVASKHSGIARINADIFNKDLKEALINLDSSTDSLDFKAEPNFHKIAKLFSANFQESSRQQDYLTAREGENDKINETGRRLFRVCTEENIKEFEKKLKSPSSSPAPNGLTEPVISGGITLD
jgi:hypothetical protein